MITTLTWLFGAEWLLGLTGLWVSRTFFEARPDDPVFDLFTGLWIAGGVGFVALGLVNMIALGARAGVRR